jgi:hypothetical protein
MQSTMLHVPALVVGSSLEKCRLHKAVRAFGDAFMWYGLSCLISFSKLTTAHAYLMQVTTAIELHKMAAAAREAASPKQEEVKAIKEADKKGGKDGKVKKEGGKKDGEKKER